MRISALQSFTESWLVPRLPDFENRHPGIGLEVTATLRYADFDRDPVDVAIRFGTGPWEGLQGVALCAPFLCEQRLASGRLCVPFDIPLESQATYHLVCRPEGLDDPRRGVVLQPRPGSSNLAATRGRGRRRPAAGHRGGAGALRRRPVPPGSRPPAAPAAGTAARPSARRARPTPASFLSFSTPVCTGTPVFRLPPAPLPEAVAGSRRGLAPDS